MGKLFREKNIVIYLFSVALVFFFFAQRSTIRLQQEILNSGINNTEHQQIESAQLTAKIDSISNNTAE